VLFRAKEESVKGVETEKAKQVETERAKEKSMKGVETEKAKEVETEKAKEKSVKGVETEKAKEVVRVTATVINQRTGKMNYK
jgi:hypothetical protein